MSLGICQQPAPVMRSDEGSQVVVLAPVIIPSYSVGVFHEINHPLRATGLPPCMETPHQLIIIFTIVLIIILTIILTIILIIIYHY